jgi:hypothetical protein
MLQHRISGVLNQGLYSLGGAAETEGKTPLPRLTWMEAAAASTAPAVARPRSSRARKKAAYYPKMRRSPQSLARRLALPFFLPAATSNHEVLTVRQQAKYNAARAEAEASRPDEGSCHAAQCLSLLRLLPPPYPPITFCAETAPKSVDGVAGRDETPAAHRAATTWTKQLARPSRLHTKSTGATVGVNAARGKAAKTAGRWPERERVVKRPLGRRS